MSESALHAAFRLGEAGEAEQLRLIAEAPYREVPLMRAQSRITMYTDASCDEDPTRPSGYSARCCFLLFADEDRVGGVADVPDDFLMQ